jgi:peptide chain release factor 2
MKTTLQIIQDCQQKILVLLEMIPHQQLQNRLTEIDHLVNEPTFWGDPRAAAVMMKDRQRISELLGRLRQYQETSSFNLEFAETYPEDIESLRKSAEELHLLVSQLEFQQMLKDPIDSVPAILSISAGAGGLEAANWVTMLLRMYSRYADANKFKIEILDMRSSDEHSAICTDAVSIRLEGPYAFGFMKSENGVHRLIRNSPFNSGDARHTSFAAVSVTPDIEDQIEVKIEEKDIEITAQTAGGPGGQNVNRIKSAIRLKHLPTGINILVRTERDQLSNKKTALKMLKSKLYELEIKKRKSENEKYNSSLTEASFGSQVRTYTETPYSLVTDHRTDVKSSNFEKVLDGDLQEFILSYLRWNANK